MFHKSFYEFHENRIKKEEACGNGNLDSEDGVISDIISKIVAKIGSLISPDKEDKKENKEGEEQSLGNKKPNFSSIKSLVVLRKHDGKDKERYK